MEFNWTTFSLEMINFLILVWLLKRFFYKPVQKAIENRRAAIEKTLTDAEAVRREADQLRLQFEGRLAEWEREKEHHRAEMLDGLEKEKQRIYARFKSQMENEKEQVALAERRKGEEIAGRAEREAFSISMNFARGLLENLADAAMERKLIDFALESLATDETLKTIEGLNEASVPPFAKIRSAYPPETTQRDRLVDILKSRVGPDLSFSWDVDRTLIAGLEINLGSHVIQANLQNEMAYFSGLDPR